MTSRIIVRNTEEADFAAIGALTERVYPGVPPWAPIQLSSHRRIFPEGQFVAVDPDTGGIVGMAASLIVWWEDYDDHGSWRDFTDAGMFTNHDPFRGRTLYGAEVMVDPNRQGQGIGSIIYEARATLAERLGLLRIRAGARLRGYHRHADTLTAEQYVTEVVNGRIGDATLTFQLRRGFEVIAVVHDYLKHDPESLGKAAVIEWINLRVATAEELAARPARYRARIR